MATALESGGLPAGRVGLARIVGRDPEALDTAGVARAAVESLAENLSDGVVAPAFWLALAGLPGGAAYKAVNTADSMVGHLDDRYRDLGRAAARLDDVLNLPASRLSALLLVAAAALGPAGVRRTVTAGVAAHRGQRAAGRGAGHEGGGGDEEQRREPRGREVQDVVEPRRGAAEVAVAVVDDAVMGAGGRRDLGAPEVRRGLRLYRVADALLIGLVAAWAVALAA